MRMMRAVVLAVAALVVIVVAAALSMSPTPTTRTLRPTTTSSSTRTSSSTSSSSSPRRSTTTSTSRSSSTSVSIAPATIPGETTTTPPEPCDLSREPLDSLSGFECAHDHVRAALAALPQPPCTPRCDCALARPLARIHTALDAAVAAGSIAGCQRKLHVAHRIAAILVRRMRSIGKRSCFTAPTAGDELITAMTTLADRSKALLGGGYCESRQGLTRDSIAP